MFPKEKIRNTCSGRAVLNSAAKFPAGNSPFPARNVYTLKSEDYLLVSK
jgi:hypothetical protein